MWQPTCLHVGIWASILIRKRRSRIYVLCTFRPAVRDIWNAQFTIWPSPLRKSFKICFLKSLENANKGHKSDSRNFEFFQRRFIKASFRLLLIKDGYVNDVTFFNFPTRFPLYPQSQRFTSIPNSGATGTTSTFQEERPCLTIMKPSYQPIGTHPSARYVSVWRSDIRQDSSSSPSAPTPCTHWSPMVITAPPHWVVTRGSRLLDRQPRCSPTVTRKGLTVCPTKVAMA